MAKKEKLEIEVEVPTKKIHVAHVYCHKGHLLCDPAQKIHDFPAIKLKLKYRGKEGVLFLDPVYGSFDNIEMDVHPPKGAVVELFCPLCGESLKAAGETCQLCSSPMFVCYLPKGGILEGCTKKGCYYHKVKIVDAEKQVSRLFENDTLQSYL